jgi:hypothetical protein
MNRALAPEPLQLLLLAGGVSVWIPAVMLMKQLQSSAQLLHCCTNSWAH